MAEALRCYRCGESLAALTLPLARLDECPKCHAHVHVCKMCTRFTTRIPKGCTEEDAPEVRDKKSANFCDYFKPNPAAYNPAEQAAADAARATLDSLFKK
jgi:phage FluMu protein Com